MWDGKVAEIGEKTRSDCWNACKDAHPTLIDLVADYLNNGEDTNCYCQNACPCMRDIGFGIDTIAPPDFSPPQACAMPVGDCTNFFQKNPILRQE